MRGIALLAAIALAGCASAPPPPDWQMNAKSALERATEAYLAGNSRVAVLDFERARAELARTGRVDLLARAVLTECAARVASLAFDDGDCPGFAPLALDAGPAERAYALYLSGRADAQQQQQDLTLLLPEAQRQAQPSAIVDPLARLVALGVRLRRGDAVDAALAVDTASARGWRRPLLAWLQVQLRQAEAAGDAGETARLKRRIGVVLGE